MNREDLKKVVELEKRLTAAEQQLKKLTEQESKIDVVRFDKPTSSKETVTTLRGADAKAMINAAINHFENEIAAIENKINDATGEFCNE